MSESSEDLGINLDSSIKKLLKAQYPNQNFRTPIVKALSICANKFLDQIIQVSADVCLEKDKNTMTNDHVYEALERKHFTSIIDKAKSIGQDIENGLKERKEKFKTPKGPELTEEERILEAKRMQEEVKLLLKKKKQADAAALKKDES